MLDTYKPVVWEYARLNITHNVLSKRKLNRLVTDGFVHGWDDPRLLTLAGLRRRGVTPQVRALSMPPNMIFFHRGHNYFRVHALSTRLLHTRGMCPAKICWWAEIGAALTERW